MSIAHSGVFVVHYKIYIKRAHNKHSRFQYPTLGNEIQQCAAKTQNPKLTNTHLVGSTTNLLKKTNLRAREGREWLCVPVRKTCFPKEHTADTFFKVVFIFPVLPLPHNSAMIITYLLYFVAALPVLFYFFYNFQHQSSSLHEAYSFSPAFHQGDLHCERARIEREPSKLDILTCCIKTRSDL